MLKKTLKIFRNSFLFLVIFSVLFSNIPFYALTSVIKESSRVANIVDKAWNLSQDDNIVDKFNSLNEVAGWVKIHEARAAVALRGANKQGSGTNGSDITLTFDTGGGAPQTGDVVILYGGRGNTSDAQAFGPITSGYTPIATINSTGPKFGVWYKVMGVTPDTTVQGEGGASTAHGVAYGAYVIDGTTIDPAIFDQVAVSTGQLSSWVPNGPAIVTQTDGAFVVTHAANSVIDTSRGTVSGYTLFTAAAGNDSNDINIQTAYVVAGAPGTYDPPAWSAWTAGIGGAVTIAFKPAPTLTTTSLSNFVSAEPGNSTVAPGSAGYVDSFGLATNSGSDTVTGATVTLAAGTGARVATVAITNDGDTVTYCSATPSGDTATLTSCGIPVTTTNTQFKIRITAISHGSMPAVPGASYAVTGTVTAFTSTNPQAGTDSGSSTLTIDNLSPGNVTGAGGSVDNGQVTTSWTNPVDADYHSAVVLRREAVAVADVPVEGTTYIVGNTIGTAIVACVVATPTATCNDTGLTNGTAYHYEIFTKDTNGNYDVGVVPTGSPFTPVPTRTYYGYLNSGTAVTLPAVTTNAVCPVASDTNLGTVSGISLLDDVDDATCIPGATRDIIWSSSAPTFSFYYNGAGYASAMDVTGVSIGFRARSQSASAILTLKLFYTEPGGAKVYFTGTPPTQALTATRTEFTVSLAGLSATGVPAGSKLGVEFSWDDPLGVRISMNATANSEKLIVTETVAAVTLSVDGYTNETEAGLNYTASCTGCGARIGGGAGFRQTVTIAGIGFGADPGVGNRSSATNNIKIGAQQIASANVTAWSATSITFLTDSAVAGDTDTDWGAEFGGTSALTVTASGATSAGLNFYVFPQVTSLSTCNSAGFPVGDGAREYNASDSVCPNGLTDGEIFLNGTRFGTASTGGYVQIFGIGATTPSWTNELIRARVPSSALYTGSLVVQQGVGSNNKTHTYTSTNFRIFPRITDFVPTSGSEGNSVTINGNHFCQGAGCPVAFDANNKVVFTSAVQATVFTSWSATSIVTAIPTGAVSGDVVVTSNSYTSNGKVFTVLSNTPTPPISLNQWKNSGLTQVIAVSGVASSTPLYLTMIMEVPGISGGTLYPQVEYKAIGLCQRY
ncbi:MAG: Fibronectin type III domain protein [Candidatus Nomurabacteria bacterium GW2011_GWB1_43_20]|nr:MAG: Fibronectin type III domain protein [Candidatus Nomurabacteria bacterium GW2011_GWB1_43_20]